MILDLFKLTGKAAIVTGAGRGLGSGLALGLAEAGADLFLVSKSESAEETKREVEKLGRRAVAFRADLSRMDSIPKAVEAAVREFGKIDILVNNAGIQRRAPVLEFAEQDWDDVLTVNQKVPFFLAQACARDMMKRKKGKIVNIASVICFSGGLTIPAYAAAKAGMRQTTMSMANELSPHGINVNAIAPGYMATDMNVDLRKNEARFKELSARIPANRWGTPDDLKGAVVYLASDASDYVHGTTLVVDGGWCSR
jgi:2-deoxy-D-gluconate 3-dehydrogenase